VEHYRDALAQIVLAKRGDVSIVRLAAGEETLMTPYEYKSMDLLIDTEFVRGLVV
jgi:hypothetical protein